MGNNLEFICLTRLAYFPNFNRRGKIFLSVVKIGGAPAFPTPAIPTPAFPTLAIETIGLGLGLGIGLG